MFYGTLTANSLTKIGLGKIPDLWGWEDQFAFETCHICAAARGAKPVLHQYTSTPFAASGSDTTFARQTCRTNIIINWKCVQSIDIGAINTFLF